MEKYKCFYYNKIDLLKFDIENELDKNDKSEQVHVINKIFYFFNKSSVDGKYAKPFLIKFFLNSSKTPIQWAVEDIYQHFQAIPKYLLASNMISDYNYIDNSGKIFTITSKESINSIISYENSAYDFEVNFGSVLVEQSVIDELQQLLEQYEIYYELSQDKSKIIVYDSQQSLYTLVISLNGKIDRKNKYEITPKIEHYNDYISLGKFNSFNGKSTEIPNDDNLALIHQCPKCKLYLICNWWNVKGTTCPHCKNNVMI